MGAKNFFKNFFRIIILGSCKEDLLYVRDKILVFLSSILFLSVSPKKMVLNRVSNGVPFLGYVILPNRLKIRNDTLRRFKHKMKFKSYDDRVRSLLSFKGHLDLCNSVLIYSKSAN